MPALSAVDRLRLNADLMRLLRERATIAPGPTAALAQVRIASQIAAVLQRLGVAPVGGLPAPNVSIYNSGTIQPKEPGMTAPHPMLARLLPYYAKHGEALAAVREAEAKGEKPTGVQKSAVTRTLTTLKYELERYNDYGRKPEGAPSIEELAQAYDAQVAAAQAEREELAGQPTLTLEELTAKATAALEQVKPREKYGTRTAEASTMLPDGSVITCTAADEQRRINRYSLGREIVRTFQYKQDGKVISKDSLLKLIGGKARQEINEPLRAAFESQAPSLEADYKDYIRRAFEHQKEAHGGAVPRWPEEKDGARELILLTLLPHCRTVGKALELDEAVLAEKAKKYGEEAAVQWFYKTNAKLGPVEHAELHSDRGGDVVVSGIRQGHKVSMVQQRVLKWTASGTPFHQFPARLYLDSKFMPEAIYAKAFKD